MADTTASSGLKQFFDQVGKAIKDASELQVLTFTGDVRSYIVPVAVKDKDGKETGKTTGINLNWEQFFTNAVATTEARLKLMAATQVKLDGDTILFIAEDNIPSLVDAHVKAVEAAQQYRQGIVTAVANLIGLA